MLKKRIPNIAISIGDFNGIGPEIILKSLSEIDLKKSIPVIIAPKTIIEYYCELFSPQPEFHFITDPENKKEGKVNVLHLKDDQLKITPGIQSAESGKAAMLSIEKSIDLCLMKRADAMVTAPISKEAVNLAGYDIPGHTEFLAAQTNAEHVLMMLVNDNLRVALVTAHVPIKEVADHISANLIKTKVQILADSLRNDFGIERPKIAVLGLNPHAGDGGVIGMEEIEIIDPVIKEIRGTQNQFAIHGPFPADGFFGRKLHTKHDAILAMYHDQGLAPFKLLSFGKGVNFTAGLPIIRTSPDHGTAFDIAGKGIADPSSFKEAYNLAVKLAKK
ncbi:MAG: 4-hydroxythreonine-4-phosphate dehydrogenase PdxA [Gracilimonas sp.]|uniref:4-hydroxythreonine-4-phosphate dehydrogenase PdxA n=1 Tax=Gracilimonas sp. TaxID=1974203 RepID=UPI00199C100F|nr:4-hydroxythreonine-4-phosphate dehydrogenase PdxA [Gracilimonas sp.]MBD3615621.1 4-hydroxythreonine-4-phosphate dehydrogenase PdxA [Gracilimonas sp.]